MAWITKDPYRLGLFPLFQSIDLLSNGRHPVVDILSLRFEIGRTCSQLPGVVFKLIGIMFECINNRLQFHFHGCCTPQQSFFPERKGWGQATLSRNHNLDGGKESLDSLFRIAHVRSFPSSLNPKDTVSNKVQHSSQGVRILITNLFCITKRIRASQRPSGFPSASFPGTKNA